MAYKFQPYVSMYVDPQSVKINEVLRKRYVDNFAAENMLDKSLQDMLVAAEFEGDVQKANELKAKIQDKAEARAERGDYESLGMDIQRDVTDFYQEYKPLEQNYQAREADKQVKQEQLARGIITNSEYESWLDYSMYTKQEDGTYARRQGIQYDENGNLDRNSIYQSVGIEATVDYSEEIRKGLQGLPATKSGGYQISGVKPKKDANGNEVKDEFGNTVMVAYDSKGAIIEEITPDQIKSVVENVFRDPKVKAHLDQTGEFATYNLGDQDLNNRLAARLEELESRLTVAGGDSRRKLQEEIGEIQKALEGTESEKRAAAKRGVINGIYEKYLEDTIDARAYRTEYGGGYGEKLSEGYLIRLRSDLAEARAAAAASAASASDAFEDYTPYIATSGGDAQTVSNPFDTDGDGVVTASEVQKKQAEASAARLTTVSNLLETHPSILNSLPDFQSDDEDVQVDEIADFLSKMSDAQLGTVAATVAEEEGIRLEVAQQDIRIARQVMLSAMEEEAAAGEMVARINEEAGFTGAALVKEAKAASDFKFDPASIGDMTPQQVAQGVANTIIHNIVRGGLGDESNIQKTFMDEKSGEQVDLAKVVAPLLTASVAEGGFGMEEQEAQDIIERAIEINRQLQEAHPNEFAKSGQHNLNYRLKELGVDDTFIATQMGGSANRRNIQMQFPTLTGEAISTITRLTQDYSTAYIDAFNKASSAVKDRFEKNSTSQVQFERSNRALEDYDGEASAAVVKTFVGEDISVLRGLEDTNGNMITVNENGVVSIGDVALSKSSTAAKQQKIENVKFTRYIGPDGTARSALAMILPGGREVVVDQSQAASGVKDIDGSSVQTLEEAVIGSALTDDIFNRVFVRMATDPSANKHVLQVPEFSGNGGNWTVEFTPTYVEREDVKMQTGFSSIKVMKDGQPIEFFLPNGRGLYDMTQDEFVAALAVVQKNMRVAAGYA